jgi:hypothetical protein
MNIRHTPNTVAGPFDPFASDAILRRPNADRGENSDPTGIPDLRSRQDCCNGFDPTPAIREQCRDSGSPERIAELHGRNEPGTRR